MDFIVYLLPAALILICIFFVICIVKRNVRGIIINLAIVLLITIVLSFYYCPKDNILGKYNFSYIGVEGWCFPNTKITNQDDINKILEVINRHTFIRSTVRTVEASTFPGNELIMLNMWDPEKGDIIHFYILNESFEKNALQIDSVMYNVRDKEALSKDIINVLKEISVIK